MDTKSRKILAMNQLLYIRSNVDMLYIKRKEGGRGLSVGECVRDKEASLEEYVVGSEEIVLTVIAENKVQCELQGDY